MGVSDMSSQQRLYETTPLSVLIKIFRTHRLHKSMNICTGCSWRPVMNVGSLQDQHEVHLAQMVVQHIAAVLDECREDVANTLLTERWDWQRRLHEADAALTLLRECLIGENQ